MGDKYIIDVKDGETLYKAVIANDGEPYITPAMGNVYTEPDLEQVNAEKDKIYDEARARGYDEGRARGYQEGLFDAWECTKKIFLPVAQEGLPASALIQIFGNKPAEYFFKENSASEAIEKIRQYEQRQKEQIQVGDEIEAIAGKAVVVYVDKHKVRYFYSNGVYAFECIDNVTKTGRHFPEIAEVLAKMKESE